MKFSTTITTIISTFFYTGYLPISGTSSSFIVCFLSGVFFTLVPSGENWLVWGWIWIMASILVTLIGIFSSTYSVRHVLNSKDPSEVVIDEVAGMMISLIPLFFIPTMQENLWLYIGISFLGFRFFDILKPSVIGWAEGLPEGWGIMMDDVLSGVAAAIVTWIASILLNLA